jgi:hypothetical protein
MTLDRDTNTLAIIQPSFIPWRGYFDMIHRADVFIFYDDVQYEKNSWRNRNKIKTNTGWQWVTVPVLSKGLLSQAIRDTKINNANPWKKKILGSISQYYSKTPYFSDIFSMLSGRITACDDNLSELCIDLTQDIARYLKIETKFLRSSDLQVGRDLHGVERVVALCTAVKAKKYLSGPRAKSYIGDGLHFREANVELEYMSYAYPPYPQLFGEFLPDMSIVDVLCHCGPDSPRYIWG